MKNGDLVVHGKRVDETDLESFQTSVSMAEWEYSKYDYTDVDKIGYSNLPVISIGVYDAYIAKHGSSNIHNINDLRDVFGEWGKQFYIRRFTLLTKEKYLPEAIEEKTKWETRIKRYQDIVAGTIKPVSAREIFMYDQIGGEDESDIS